MFTIIIIVSQFHFWLYFFHVAQNGITICNSRYFQFPVLFLTPRPFLLFHITLNVYYYSEKEPILFFDYFFLYFAQNWILLVNLKLDIFSYLFFQDPFSYFFIAQNFVYNRRARFVKYHRIFILISISVCGWNGFKVMFEVRLGLKLVEYQVSK